jgi:hypothetical protein
MQSHKHKKKCRHHKYIEYKEDYDSYNNDSSEKDNYKKCCRKSDCSECPNSEYANIPAALYIPAPSIEVRPNVLVEKGTILYDECSIEEQMQQLAFK